MKKNMPGFTSARLAILSDISHAAYLTPFDEISIKLINSMALPYTRNSLKINTAPNNNESGITYTHTISFKIALPDASQELRIYLGRFIIEKGILLLKDTEGKETAFGTLDYPIKMDMIKINSPQANGFRGFELNFNVTSIYPALDVV